MPLKFQENSMSQKIVNLTTTFENVNKIKRIITCPSKFIVARLDAYGCIRIGEATILVKECWKL